MIHLYNRLMEANTCKEVEELIKYIETNFDVAWRPVGDTKMNMSRINIGSDPAAGVTERITNAIDGVLERLWLEHGYPMEIRSPREAVEKWLGIKNGRLVSIDDKSELRKLGDMVRVILKESGAARKPTVEIRDKGIGILAEDFHRTILGLNETNKLDKFFLAGAYGQGGSTALAHSEYAMIISRKFSVDKSIINPVAFTIVRYNPGDYNVEKQGYYEYIVDATQDNNPFQFKDISLEQFECGTLVRHIEMDVGKYYTGITNLTDSFWYLVHHYLFDTVLPVIISDTRAERYQTENRTISGNHRRLTRRNTIDSNSSKLEFRKGNVEITWWVLQPEDNPKDNKRRITLYTKESHPIIITYNGQKQGEFPNTIIRDQLRLPYLDKYLVVHVNCDGVDAETRRHLFSTTRESVKNNEVSRELRALITDYLASEEDLEKHNETRKKMLLSRDSEGTSENLRRRLANKINKVINVGEEGKSGRVQPPHSTKNDYKKKPIPVKNPPTYLSIVSKEPRLVYVGKSFFIKFETDAESELFNSEEFLVNVEPSEFASYTGLTTVKKGHGTVHFKASGDIKEGDTATISIVLGLPDSHLSDNISLKVIPLPKKAGKGKGKVGTPNVRIERIHKDDPFWLEEQWDEQSVSKVVIETDSITIFMSVENRNLTKLTNRAIRNKKYSSKSIIETYCEHMGFYSFLAYKSFNENQREDIEVLNSELQRASELICGMIEDLIDVIAVEKEAAAVID